VIVQSVDQLTISSKGKKSAGPILIQFTDLEDDSATICGNLKEFHANLEFLPEVETTGNNPKSSYEAKAKEGNLQTSDTFSLNQCQFKEFQLQLTDSDADICIGLPKGDSCTLDSECCSFKCKGPSEAKTCK
jgi:hypothetical protein